jgi:hypothetical protein
VQKKPSPAAARRPLPPAGEVSIRLVGNDKPAASPRDVGEMVYPVIWRGYEETLN